MVFDRMLLIIRILISYKVYTENSIAKKYGIVHSFLKGEVYSRNSLRREIGCVLIIQQKFRNFEFFYCAQWKNSNFQNFCWMIRMQPISVLKLFLLIKTI